MAGYNLANLQTDIRNYTEVDSNVFTTAVLNRFIENAEYRIAYDIPMDSDRFFEQGTMAAYVTNISVQAGSIFFIRFQLFNSSNSNHTRALLPISIQTFSS